MNRIQTNIRNLAGLRNVNAYTTPGALAKNHLHSQGRALLRNIAAYLGLPEGTFDIRSNRGGVAVSGEVTLHAERLYVQLSEIGYAPEWGIVVLYRTCKGRTDYTGGDNRYAKLDSLQRTPNLCAFLAACLEITRGDVA